MDASGAASTEEGTGEARGPGARDAWRWGGRGLAAALAGVLLAAGSPASAQQPAPSWQGVENSAAFEPLDLPDPNAYRSGSGRPGPEYWQQEVDYEIDVRLEPGSHRVTGSETITYTNNSPDELDHLWLQLDQNLFRRDSRGARITQPGQRFSGAFRGGGYEIAAVRVARGGGEPRAVDHLIEGTTMRVDLEEPLSARGGSLRLSLDFAFRVPSYGADRMGRLEVERGTVYELAQWYPRMFTYDDVRGWNVLPYLGLGEFYLEYGSFDVRITVPRDFLVVATGELANPSEVLTAEQRGRLERARGSAETVEVVAPGEVGDADTRPEGEGPLTWHFRADSVRDFSWATSQAFIWDAAGVELPGGRRVLAMSAYPHEGLGSGGRAGWEESTQYVRHSVRHYSERWTAYPYPAAVNVAGVVGGMEYPGIVFCSVQARGPSLFGVTDHEFGHTWFPMVVGSDERRHFWMDEGLNSFLGYYSTVAYYGDQARSRMQGTMAMRRFAALMERQRQPSAVRSDRMRMDQFGFMAYRKPALGLVILREFVLGPERFDPALKAYIRRWSYRHPKPADLFRTIEDVAGEELDWFWRGWFHTTDVLDQAVTGVETSGDTTRVRLENQAGLVMPLELELTYADGETERRRVPVEAWHTRDRYTETVVGRRVERVVVDPDGHLPDVERGDNTWRRGG